MDSLDVIAEDGNVMTVLVAMRAERDPGVPWSFTFRMGLVIRIVLRLYA